MVTTQLDLDDLIREDRVSGLIYTDPDIFDLEMEKIFGGSWLMIAHESMVAEPGDYFTTWVGKTPVIVTRTADDNTVRIFYNRCTHRGNLVCQYEEGNASYFRCAYHGWTFNNSGKLMGVPFREAYADHLNFQELGLAEAARCEVYNGFVFVSLRADVPPLTEWLGPAHRYLDEFAAQGPAGIEFKAGVQKAMYRGNWKFQNENDADNYHTDFTHQVGAVIRSMRAAKNGENIGRFGQPPGTVVRALGHGHSANSRVQSVGGGTPGDLYGAAKGTAMTRKLLEQLEAKIGVEQAREALRNAGGPPHTFRLFPNIVIIGTQIRITRPISVGISENYYYPALLKNVPDEVNAIRMRLHEQGFGPAGFTSPDDVEVFARNQLGLQAKAENRDWQIMARGLHRESVDDEGALWGPVKDETGMRSIYRYWKELMAR